MLNSNGYIIRISENAIINMCLSGLEAYCVLHKNGTSKNNMLEIYGQLWGHEVTLPNGKTLYCVEMLSIDTSAIMKKDSVEPYDDALQIKRDVLTSFWPQFDYLGDFHTHPYKNYESVMEDKLYKFSEQDINSIEKYSADWTKYNYRVGIVLTIAGMQKKGSKQSEWIDSSTIQFTLGNYRLWLKGYVAYTDGDNNLKLTKDNDEVVLDCPAIVGLVGEYTEFGRLEGKRRKMHKPGEIDSYR